MTQILKGALATLITALALWSCTEQPTLVDPPTPIDDKNIGVAVWLAQNAEQWDYGIPAGSAFIEFEIRAIVPVDEATGMFRLWSDLVPVNHHVVYMRGVGADSLPVTSWTYKHVGDRR